MESFFMRLPLLVASLATGCLGVPNVTFGPDAAPDVGAEGAKDSSDSGAPADATNSDGSDSATCPQGIPDGASICCGPVPCKGAEASCQSECTNCENDCPGQTCCLDKHGNYQGCAASPSACP
jgi:hypothetical protein